MEPTHTPAVPQAEQLCHEVHLTAFPPTLVRAPPTLLFRRLAVQQLLLHEVQACRHELDDFVFVVEGARLRADAATQHLLLPPGGLQAT